MTDDKPIKVTLFGRHDGPVEVVLSGEPPWPPEQTTLFAYPHKPEPPPEMVWRFKWRFGLPVAEDDKPTYKERVRDE